jgi:V/A-type H+-transporting ATPase subunit I
VAVDKLTRVLLAVHDELRDGLIKSLQRRSVLHIVRTEPATGQQSASDVAGRYPRLAAALEQMLPREKRPKSLLGASRPVLARAEFDQIAADYDPSGHLTELAECNRVLADASARDKFIRQELIRLEPWRGLRHAPAVADSLRSAKVSYGRFANVERQQAAEERLAELPATVQVIAETSDGVWCVVAAAADAWPAVQGAVAEIGFEPVDLTGTAGTPAESIAELQSELTVVQQRRAGIEKTLDELAAQLPQLRVAADAAAAQQVREDTVALMPRTATATIIHGWVRQREFGVLRKLVEATSGAVVVEVEPEPGEEEPVALRNPKLFRPFELVLELFSLPSHGELDPTVLLAPFFAVSFGLCLTDAGYGIVASIATYLLLRKLGAGNKLLGMILWGSLITIPAGALVGGWFGDLPDRLGLAWLLRLKDGLMWFDPVKDPMKFFILSLAFGYIHMMYGMVIEIVDCIRVRDIGGALLGQLPWFAAINALLALVLVGGAMPGWGQASLMALILVSVAAVIVFTQRSAATMRRQWVWFVTLASGLLYLGVRFGWLPSSLAPLSWIVAALLLVLGTLTAVELARSRRLGFVAAGLGLAGVVLLGLALAGRSPGIIAALVLVAFCFVAPGNRANLSKFAWGGYALYGATSYIGVVLSYIRLMALGMVTGGIAVTVNVIAWMVLKIPVVGIVLALLVLIGGHAYNIAVNILGAFVHSLRLNYVEFFPRFYQGGGEPFVPLREEYQFVSIKEASRG